MAEVEAPNLFSWDSQTKVSFRSGDDLERAEVPHRAPKVSIW